MLVGVLTCCALLYSVYDLKATLMNVQQELILYEVEMSHNVNKNICCTKEGAVDSNSVTRWLKKVYSGYKNFSDQAFEDYHSNSVSHTLVCSITFTT